MRFLLQHGDTIARIGIAMILPALLIAWGRSKRTEPPQDEVEHWEPCAECIPSRAAMVFCKTCRKPLCSKHCTGYQETDGPTIHTSYYCGACFQIRLWDEGISLDEARERMGAGRLLKACGLMDSTEAGR